ncbi:MAG: hypothetical protein ABIH89_09165 [Elusimicrobiota bacterium]
MEGLNDEKENRKKGGKTMKRTGLFLIVLALCGFTGGSLAVAGDFSEERNEYREEINETTGNENRQTEDTGESIGEDSEEGKTLTDVNGYRVRVEKYFSRPADNQVKTTILNTREELDNRVDRSVWTGTFNQDLPEDLRGIARTMWGSTRRRPGKPDYYLTNTERISTCGENSLEVTRDDGWLFKRADIGEGLYIVLFNEEKLSANDMEKLQHIRYAYDKDSNIPGVIERYFPNEDSILTSVWVDPSVRPDYEISIGGSELYDKVKLTFADGTFLTKSRYVINDEGDILARGTRRGTGNLEVICEATEFNGETIDIVVTPGPGQEEDLDIEN